MAEFNVLGKIILGAVLMILGAVVIGVIADLTQQQTTQSNSVANEIVDISAARLIADSVDPAITFTLSKAPTGWKAETDDCDITKYSTTNGSTALTVTTDYTVSTTGIVSYKNSSTMRNQPTNLTYVSYSTCRDDYLNSSWGRSVLNMLGGFIAIMLLAAGVGIFYSIYKEIQ